MNVEPVNKSLSMAIESKAAMDRLSVPHKALLKASRVIEYQQEELWETWNKQVIDAGNEFIESRQRYGPGWEQEYDSLGYGVSYSDACKYISCAQRPDAGEGMTSLEEWAEASAEYDQPVNLVNKHEPVATGVTAQGVSSSELTDRSACDNYDCLDHGAE